MRPPENSVVAADWVVPVTGAPIRSGAVAISGDRVGWLGPLAELPARWSDAPVDRRPGVIVPGLVNAHAHLQYTGFAALGQRRYDGFEEWSFAFEADYLAVTDPAYWRASALAGARQAVAAGTTVFADIITNDEARGALAACGVTGVEYLEAIGELDRRWFGGQRARFLARLGCPGPTPLGVSPHAMYSLDGSVIKDLMAIAADRGLRTHLHVGESALELNLYRHGAKSMLDIYGELRDEFDLVRRGGVGRDTASYADSLGVLVPTAHLAHAIYLDRAGRDLLLRRGTQVALCPRSNAVLGLGPAPVAGYLSEGHEVAVGTDSLASSPSLDLMADVAELAVIARDQGYRGDDLAARLVRAATLGGAMALGLADRGYGSLRVGGPADLAVFDIQADDDAVEAALVSHGAGHCTLTMAGGALIHDAIARRLAGRFSGHDHLISQVSRQTGDVDMPGAPRADSIGPVDVAVVAFDGDRFNGEVAPALVDLQASGMVRLIDCGFVRKDKHGQITAVELVDQDVAGIYDQIPDPRFDLLSKAELSSLAGALDPGSSALVLVWENAWAARLSAAIRESHGRVTAFERIPVAEVNRALADLAEQPDSIQD